MARVVFFLIGCLLTVTAVLKLWMLLTDPFADVRLSLSREVLWVVVVFELFLAFANFVFGSRKWLPAIDSFVFTAFGIFSCVRYLLGFDGCGCAGAIEIPNLVFIVTDFAIVAFLALFCWQQNNRLFGLFELRRELKSLRAEQKGVLIGLSVFLVGVFLIQLPIAEKFRVTVLGGRLISGKVDVLDDVRLGKETVGVAKLVNLSDHPARVMGSAKSCSCFALARDIRGTIIPANSTVTVPIVIRPKKVGQLRQRIDIYLQHPEQFRVGISVFSFAKGSE